MALPSSNARRLDNHCFLFVRVFALFLRRRRGHARALERDDDTLVHRNVFRRCDHVNRLAGANIHAYHLQLLLLHLFHRHNYANNIVAVLIRSSRKLVPAISAHPTTFAIIIGFTSTFWTLHRES